MKSEGYGYITAGRGHRRPAHVVAWEAINGPVPDGGVVHHGCENKGCVNPDHLELKTRPDHTSLHNARLTPEQVAEIRRLSRTMSQRKIAALFGIGRGSVRYHLASSSAGS
jgi:hypothetical protein